MSFDFEHAVGNPLFMQHGLRRLSDGEPQFTPVRPGSRHQREKLAVLSAFAGEALVQREGFDAAPAVHALCRHAASEQPQAWRWNGHRAVAIDLGVAVDVASGQVHQEAPGSFGLGDEVLRCVSAQPAAWRLATLLSLAFEEDFALVDVIDATVPWMAVCLPSHWAPRDQVDQHFADQPALVLEVDTLRRAGVAPTRLLCADARWECCGWNVTDHPRLHAHPSRMPTQRWAERDPLSGRLRAWWRTERRTFVPLPGAGHSLVLIHVCVQPLQQVIDTPRRALALADSLASMSPALLAWRNLDAVCDELLHDLRARAAAAA